MQSFTPLIKGQPDWHDKYNQDLEALYNRVEPLAQPFTAGVWTPALTDEHGNSIELTASDGQWSRAGALLNVRGRLVVGDAGAATGTECYVPLPAGLSFNTILPHPVGTLRITSINPPSNYAGGMVAIVISSRNIRFDYCSSTGIGHLPPSTLKPGSDITFSLQYEGA